MLSCNRRYRAIGDILPPNLSAVIGWIRRPGELAQTNATKSQQETVRNYCSDLLQSDTHQEAISIGIAEPSRALASNAS
jgi:hypothetical protein